MRRNDEVIFQLLPVAVVRQIHPWIHAMKIHASVGRHIRAPLPGIVPNEIVHTSSKLFQPRNLRIYSGSRELHSQNSGWSGFSNDPFRLALLNGRFLKNQHCLCVARQKQRVSTAAR